MTPASVGYAWQAITHELGHTLGLAHGGDYNASNGVPITYQGSAYFYQDSQQYTIMSYFDGAYTGQAAVKWDGANSAFMYAQTPQVHDILAVQNIYGADYTTRSGDTVYGFHSTADRGVFDFSTNTAPIVTIWDGGGNDTLDLSGFNGDDFIDLHEGAFSSAGYTIDAGPRPSSATPSASRPSRISPTSTPGTASARTAAPTTISRLPMAPRSRMRSAARAMTRSSATRSTTTSSAMPGTTPSTPATDST